LEAAADGSKDEVSADAPPKPNPIDGLLSDAVLVPNENVGVEAMLFPNRLLAGADFDAEAVLFPNRLLAGADFDAKVVLFPKRLLAGAGFAGEAAVTLKPGVEVEGGAC